MTSAIVFAAGIQTPSPWTDEGATCLALQRGWHQLLGLLQGPDAPLVPYYVLAKGWVAAVQALWPSVSTLVAARLLSAAAATGTVLLLHVLVSRNAGRFSGFTAGLLLISISGFSRFAQEARGYTLLALAATAAWLARDQWLNAHPARTVPTRPPTKPPLQGVGKGVLRAIPYTASLAAVAVIHTFGLFQWPAHVLATLISPPPCQKRRPTRLAATMAVMAVAAGLTVRQVATSITNGTGPVGLDAHQHFTSWELLNKIGQTITVSSPATPSVLLLGLTLAGAVLAVKGRHAAFARSLLVWLCIPLLLELAVASTRTNLFRIRYWIGLLPPVAALAGLGTAALASTLLRLAGDLFVRPGLRDRRWLRHATGAAVAATAVGAQIVLVLPAQLEIRSPSGHGQNLSGILELISAARRTDPDLPVLIPSANAEAALAAVDPALQADNPLRHLDLGNPSVFTRPTSRADVRAALVGADRLLWICQETSGEPTSRQVPAKLHGMGLTVRAVTITDLGWTALLLQRG